jgi:3-(3-hydroxy-phenyl)propionate hydroxylase
MSQTRIIIAGAGQVGIVSALALAQHDYSVTLLEAEAVIDDNPRAVTTHPSTLEMIARVGLRGKGINPITESIRPAVIVHTREE